MPEIIPSVSGAEQRPTTADRRAAYIAGLRAFADWLEANPDVPAGGTQRLLQPLHTNAAVEEFAAKHDLTVVVDDDGNASCDVLFGPITYHAYGYEDFATFSDQIAERHARQWADSKGLTIQPTEGGAS